jgi:hypothetical protein
VTIGSLFGEAAGLALIAAIYPPAMLVAALYLASERPGKTALAFVVGGILMVATVGIIALVVMRAGGLSHFGQHRARYGLRLGLGVVGLMAAAVLYMYKPKARDPAKPKKPNPIVRMSARPRPVTAFAVGAVMFFPSVTFIAAVQVVATAKTSIAAAVAAMVMIIVLTVAFAWIPLVAYLVTPQRTVTTLRSLEGWLKRHGKTVLAAAVAAVGIILTIQGITGVT